MEKTLINYAGITLSNKVSMNARYRKPNMSLMRSGSTPRALGEQSSSPTFLAKPRRIHRIAVQRQLRHTPAEKEFEGILNDLGGGVLRNKFIREWAFKNWILDFFLYEVRVGIEVDGGYHSTQAQQKRDKDKSDDCEAAGITLLRISNSEVFGEREALIEKIRIAYREGLRRSRLKPK